MNEKMGLIIYWVIFIAGCLSFVIKFSVEYGIIYTMMITLACGVINLLIAWNLREKYLIIVSVLLIASPYLMFLFI